MRDNRVRAALKRGEPVIGTLVQEIRSPAIALMLADAGFDFLFIDMKHGAYNLETVSDIIKVARLADIVPLVRVPDHLYYLITYVLDIAAMGVMLSGVETRESVERAVALMRYPPLGERSFSLSAANQDTSLSEFIRHANENILAILQIEHQSALERIDDLMSAPGVDVVLISPIDLTLSLGAADFGAPPVQEAVNTLVAAGKRHGVATGMHAREVEYLKQWREQGMTMLACATEVDFIISGARATVNALRPRRGPYPLGML